MNLAKAMFDYARKNGECEIVLRKTRDGIENYMRVVYDKEYDKYSRKLSSYFDLKNGLFLMDERSQSDVNWILKKYTPVTVKILNLPENAKIKNFILKYYHLYDNTGVNIFA